MNKEIVWSEYQKAIFEEVKNGNSNLLLEARAGAAKTSTILEALKYIPSHKKTLVVAFNKKVALELEERSPGYSNISVSTLHSFGFKAIRQAFGKVKLDKDKSFKIIQKLMISHKANPKDKDDYETIYELKKCLDLSKSLIIDDPIKLDDLMDEFDISLGSLSREKFIQTVIIALGECKKNKDVVDFADMVWMPFVLNLPIEKFDEVLIDETQDLTPAQLYLAFSASHKNGRIICAGDTNQVLYAWAGADINGLGGLEKRLNAKIFPLPISYRCPKKVIFEAQKFVPDITYAPGAKDGNVVNIFEKEIILFVRPNDFVLSRTNAPLVKLCFQLWKHKIPASIKGKDLGPALLGLIAQSKKKTVKAFLAWLETWANEEINRLKKKNRNANSILDRVECLSYLSINKIKISDLIDTIKSLFENKDGGGVVNLGTIHWSKGMETNRVFLLMKTLTFGNGQEEKNCEYVALTRAKETLFYVR